MTIQVKIASGSLNQIPLDWEGNKKRIVEAIQTAKDQGVGVLCLPELCISGYGCEDMFLSPHTARMSWDMLNEILPETRGLVVSVGLPVYHRNAVFSVVAMIVDGSVVGLTAKQSLAGDGIHYEPRWFKPWPEGVRNVFHIDDQEIPVGDLYYNVGGVKIGFEICEDAWVAQRPGARLARRSCDVILNPSASHFAFGKVSIRERFVLEGSRAFGVTYVYCNMSGNEAGRAIYDGGGLIGSQGTLVARGRRLSFQDVQVISASVDLEASRLAQAKTASHFPDLKTDDSLCLTVPFKFREAGLQEQGSCEAGTWETSPQLKEEEFTRAVSLGLYDYLRKSRSQGFVVSLSGGADSTAVAALCSLMVRLGVEELGLEVFKEKLSHIRGIVDAKSSEDIVHALLTTVYQGTENSSETTKKAAENVAKAIGATHLNLQLEEVHRRYRDLVSEALEEKLGWDTHDIALQNIQARLRAPSVWMIANIKGALLLSTSNRSEAAVGYATMDGDTSGGLSPIAGIDKAFLRTWLQWAEKYGPSESGPIPELSSVNKLQPTAELRPVDSKQTDEEDLMPYVYLDKIERLAIRDKKSPVEIYSILRRLEPELEPAQLKGWITRFFQLWSRNQWKRERYAPSFHLDDENLDPKTWCRFPILSGGFAKELEQLQKIK